ncbi:MAG: HIRAN domain-containing protein [bacterium]
MNNIKQLGSNSVIKLKRDYKNKYDKNAIEVIDKSDVSLGYIPKELACILADRLDDGEKYIAKIDKIISNRRKTSLNIRILKAK